MNLFDKLTLTRRIRQAKKSKDTEYIPYTASIYKMCMIANKPEYFLQIRNRIEREVEQSDDLSNYVWIDMDNPEDISLSNDGILIFFEILTSYFSEEDVRALLVYVMKMNREGREFYDYEHMFDSFTIEQLEDFIEGFKAYIPQPGKEEAKQIAIKHAIGKLKLKKRKQIFK